VKAWRPSGEDDENNVEDEWNTGDTALEKAQALGVVEARKKRAMLKKRY
jgi:hypothetical protein